MFHVFAQDFIIMVNKSRKFYRVVTSYCFYHVRSGGAEKYGPWEPEDNQNLCFSRVPCGVVFKDIDFRNTWEEVQAYINAEVQYYNSIPDYYVQLAFTTTEITETFAI